MEGHLKIITAPWFHEKKYFHTPDQKNKISYRNFFSKNIGNHIHNTYTHNATLIFIILL